MDHPPPPRGSAGELKSRAARGDRVAHWVHWGERDERSLATTHGGGPSTRRRGDREPIHRLFASPSSRGGLLGTLRPRGHLSLGRRGFIMPTSIHHRLATASCVASLALVLA